MKNIEKILVGLDLTSFDQHVIFYTKFLNSILKAKNIHFVHVQKELNMPEEILERFPALMDNIEKTFIEEMVHENQVHYLPGTDVTYDVYQGIPFQELLDHSKEESVDLIIVGKQDDDSNTERKMARKIATNILFVPKLKKRKLKNILVPIDFSPDSEKSLLTAVGLAEQSGAEVTCLHSYEVPIGYSKTGKTFEEFSEIMKGHAKKDFENLYAKIDFRGVTVNDPVICLNNHNKTGDKIVEKADELETDLIVIGARGRTKLASILLGSVAEQLVTSNLKCPLLLSKKDPDHLMNFWDTINHL